MKDNLSLANIWRRLKGATPSFFNKIAWLCGICSALGIGIMALAAQYPAAFPEGNFWVHHSSTLFVVGLIGGLIAKSTLKENNL